ncbi:MAG TPA: PDZ domain-containing protein [Pyrinomonadaceae bacterium]|nr:PDZ domain-containing protein [Pyrinomonadaceae bacterium]
MKLTFLVAFIVGAFCVTTAAQTSAPSPERHKTPPATTPARVIVQNRPPAPQVVTILHTINGIKALILIKNKEQAEALAGLGEGFNLEGEVHTNVIAGLALDDGQTIVAWLPEAEAEMPPAFYFPRAPSPPQPPATTAPQGKGAPPVTAVAATPRVSTITIPGMAPFNIQGNFFEPADLKIITRDGKRIVGHYLGLDGLTGLSLITLSNGLTGSLPETDDSKEVSVTVGQRFRVIGPQPAPGTEGVGRTPMYIRIGETEAIVVDVVRSPSGGIARLKAKSTKFTPANIGGIAINDDNQTLGIVSAVEGGEATIVPLGLVRMAAKRVTARKASVPRPWLGIKGEPISPDALERILRDGWQIDRARALTEKRQGILLSWVAPGSPAARAKLKRGDVILTVNNDFIRNAEEFTYLLDEATPETPVHFTVARPEKEVSEAMEIRLSESPDPFLGRRRTWTKITTNFGPGSLLGEGIEAIALKPQVATRLGASGGLLVLSVRPATDAFKAGLRPGDVIESIDGQPVRSGAGAGMFPVTPGVRSNCIVVRNKERISLTFQYQPDEDDEHDKPDKP